MRWDDCKISWKHVLLRKDLKKIEMKVSYTYELSNDVEIIVGIKWWYNRWLGC